MEYLQHTLSALAGYIWGLPLLILLVGTGIYLTIMLKGLQFRTLFHSLHLALIVRKEDGEGEISHFQALMTALSATVGTGNIAGVATAIATGGPGALFWMWVTGLFGMATKFSEAVLAVHFRTKNTAGEYVGGPMYYLKHGLPWPKLGKYLAVAFAIFAATASFGIGNMVQSNSVADAAHSSFGIPPLVSGLTLSVVTGLVILGGIRSIGKVTGFLVPIMITFYIIGACIVLLIHPSETWLALKSVLTHAFSPTAAVGGFSGALVKQAIQMGVSRGVFSNESGLGSSPIAAAAAQTTDPVRQALVSMTQTFIDTIVVCTLTGLAILSTKAWIAVDAHGHALNGAPLTAHAFNTALPSMGNYIVTIGLMLFAYSTILGWCYYGEKSLEFLFGNKIIIWYRILFIIFITIGSVSKLTMVWSFADITNGLMAFPNLIGLLILSPVIIKQTNRYMSNKKKTKGSSS